MDYAGPDRNLLVLSRDRGQVEMAPAAIPQQLTREVVFVEALHHENDGTASLVIEAGQKRRPIPLVDGTPGILRLSVASLHWIIDNDDISTATGEGAADRNGETSAAFGRHAFGLAILGEPHVGEERAIPVARHHGAELSGEGRGKLKRIGDAGKPHARVMPEAPGHVSYRRADRFERPGRLRDNEPPVLAPMHLHQFMDDRIDMPIVQISVSGRHGLEHLGAEGTQILPQGGVQHYLGFSHHRLHRFHRSDRAFRLPRCAGAP